MASSLLAPYLKAFNAMPRLILAPIFAVWFGLGVGSKVALGITLVFFIVFFNVYQGIKEVNPVVLAIAYTELTAWVNEDKSNAGSPPRHKESGV